MIKLSNSPWVSYKQEITGIFRYDTYWITNTYTVSVHGVYHKE